MSKCLEGGCLCGAVHYRAEGEPAMIGDCYCVDCRKSSGTSHCTHICIAEDGFTMEGEVRFYDHPADSGHVVSRGFCPTCGCPILSRNDAMPGMVFLRASTLDDLDAVEPQMAVYASRAPRWANIDRAKPVFATMPEGGPASVMGDS